MNDYTNPANTFSPLLSVGSVSTEATVVQPVTPEQPSILSKIAVYSLPLLLVVLCIQLKKSIK